MVLLDMDGNASRVVFGAERTHGKNIPSARTPCPEDNTPPCDIDDDLGLFCRACPRPFKLSGSSPWRRGDTARSRLVVLIDDLPSFAELEDHRVIGQTRAGWNFWSMPGGGFQAAPRASVVTTWNARATTARLGHRYRSRGGVFDAREEIPETGQKNLAPKLVIRASPRCLRATTS